MVLLTQYTCAFALYLVVGWVWGDPFTPFGKFPLRLKARFGLMTN